ncbi:Cbwd1 [Symbiodinium sp. CCMP2592]|nr:Cbwd1 [Symbiodinium sp. CCMP2592]
MKGKFRRAYRADLPGADAFEDVSDSDPPDTGVDLVLGRLGSSLQKALEAVAAVSSPTPGRQGVLAVLLPEPEGAASQATEHSEGEEPWAAWEDPKVGIEELMKSAGADAVIVIDHALDGSADARRLLLRGLRQVRKSITQDTMEEDDVWGAEEAFLNPFSERAQVLFDIRKCRTGDSTDLLCTGGLLDLVRGSLTCSTEEERNSLVVSSAMAPLNSPGPIPVTIIAGSFGVGKTTACNQLLHLLASQERSVAVITHRFAEEYACQPLLVSSRCSLLEEVYDYGSGCLCCTPGGELNQRLNSMIAWGERYDHVLIRTGPAADPLIFADAVQRSSAYRIAGIVTVVDATGPCFEDQLSGSSLDQLCAADVLLVRSKDQDASQRFASLKLKDASIHMWKNPLSEAEIGLLTCRSAGREYVCKPSNLVPNLMASHETTLRAVQIVENGAVSNVDVCKAWMMNLMNQGFCIRLKAVLPVATPLGSQSLLVNAVRGKRAEFQMVAEAPPQVYMGDLPVLVGMRDIDADEPMCRIFILLGPPSVKGLGDMPELLAAMPSSVDLSETFLADILGR